METKAGEGINRNKRKGSACGAEETEERGQRETTTKREARDSLNLPTALF